MSKKALITGITGQDGSYLAELLVSKGYEVHGFVRRIMLEMPEQRFWRLSGVLPQVQLHPVSLESFPSLYQAVSNIQPDECYHLAAHSFVSYSFDDEYSTMSVNINGTHQLLSTIKSLAPKCRFYFAGTSEMFGRAEVCPQDEMTRFHPRSIYGISKLAGFELTRNYRDQYEMHASSGILFNHESPRRGLEFVTRKITAGVARIKTGQATSIKLGNLEAQRDWGYAREYVEAMWLMLQQEKPDDYVIATGRTHTVREFAELAFATAGLDYRDHVTLDEQLFRPSEQRVLSGNAAKARTQLGWEPKTPFEEIVREMVKADLARQETRR